MKKNTGLTLLSALIVPLVASNATRAADPGEFATGEPPEASSERPSGFRGKLHDWNVIVGAGAVYGPKFEGSKDFEVMPAPFFSASFFNDYLHVGPTGLLVDVYKVENFKISAKGGMEFGRDEDDSDHLKGLGDIDSGAKIGGVISYELGPIELTAGIDKIIGGSDGVTGTFGAEYSHMVGQFIFSAGASATWADKNYMKSYFGVTPLQSARSGLAVYDAGAGFKRIDLSASVTYLASEHWFIRGQAELGILTGDAQDSPVVQKDTQPSVMMFVGYKF
ncbi:MltA-interacting MipA family protein [Rhizobium leguminosarum]|uniref:MltA-interacting MipA family protein n=1 Tax=Rhizobium leguminosarum TaxID=384 RepID=A0A1L3ZCH5_RHILE|nr:MipA/OmpV family protein [Rhizobium leguminosarum]API53353.1 MltA-interacting MipA family protein [Rhizobium leguminosarum]